MSEAATMTPEAAAPTTTEAAPPPASEAAPQSLGQRMADATATTVESVGGGTPPGSQPAQPAESNWQGVRDFAKAQGVDLPYDDDGAALSALLAAHRQLQERSYYADLGQRIAPFAPQVQDFLRQRRQQQAAQQAQPAAWAAPEFRKEWLQQVERDEATGLLRSRPGYDPAIADKVRAYADWREQFLDNPEKVVSPLIEERARQLIDARFAEHQQRSQADALVGAHAPWMFSQGPGGGRQLTPEGLLYAQAAKGLWDSGLRDVRMLDSAATAAVENAVLRRRIAAATGAAPAAPPALAQPVGGGAVRPAAGLVAAAAPSKGSSLREILNHRLNGVGDEDASL